MDKDPYNPPNIFRMAINMPEFIPFSKIGNSSLKLLYLAVSIERVIPEIIIKTIPIIVIVMTDTISLRMVYIIGTMKNNSRYQVGVSINILVCIEFASTAALSTKVISIVKINKAIRMFPKVLPTAL